MRVIITLYVKLPESLPEYIFKSVIFCVKLNIMRLTAKTHDPY